ncbi:MAG: response regulator [Candidatus Limnocylindria bacterium]
MDEELASASGGRTGARVMVVDDEPDIGALVGELLRDEGHAVRAVTDSAQALDAFADFHPDLVTLDVMMPSIDGISLCLELRRASDVPILFLSAKQEPPDKVVGLRMGADDYLGKPFDADELVARVEALLRRSQGRGREAGPAQLRFGRFVVDLASVQAVAGDRQVPLTPSEFRLLRALASDPGRVFAREELLASVFDYRKGGGTRLVDVHVGRLRRKLEAAGVSDVTIGTKRGFGYVLRAPPGAG